MAIDMVIFNTARKEGRALEHAMTKESGSGTRMKDPSSGKFVLIRNAETAKIRKDMQERVDLLLPELAEQGLHFSAGEAPVILSEPSRSRGEGRHCWVKGDIKSVDLRCWVSSRKTYGLLEVKWSRKGLPTALGYGAQCCH